MLGGPGGGPAPAAWNAGRNAPERGRRGPRRELRLFGSGLNSKRSAPLLRGRRPVEIEHALEPVGDPVLLVSGRAIENGVRLAGKGRPEVRGIGMRIEETWKVGLNAVQSFLELGARIHGGKLFRVVLMG